MTCRRCQRLLSRHLDGDLSPSVRRAVDDHLAVCAACASVRRELSVVTGQLGALRQPDPGEALWRTIDARLDAEERRPGPRHFPLLAPALGGAALLATAGAAHLWQARSLHEARALDAELRAASNGALVAVERRYAAVEAEAARLAGDPEAVAAAAAGDEQDPNDPTTPPSIIAPATGHLAAPVDDPAPLQADLDGRSRRVLRYAERWMASTEVDGAELPSVGLRDPFAASPGDRE